ncbi:MAG: helix-turn-helix domain-containing protein, partial [Longimicrobiales bacterium]
QAELAAAAGVGTATLQRLETGANTNLATLIQVLRALGRLGDLDVLVADVEVSPLEISGARGTPRGRASGSGRSEGDDRG